MGPDVALEAEVGVLQEDAGVVEAGAADGELMKGRPGFGRVGGRGKEIRREGAAAAGAAADGADERGEAGGDAGEAGPVSGIGFEFGEDVEDDFVGEEGKGRGGAVGGGGGGGRARDHRSDKNGNFRNFSLKIDVRDCNVKVTTLSFIE